VLEKISKDISQLKAASEEGISNYKLRFFTASSKVFNAM
jgi:hypothetical protein